MRRVLKMWKKGEGGVENGKKNEMIVGKKCGRS